MRKPKSITKKRINRIIDNSSKNKDDLIKFIGDLMINGLNAKMASK